MLLPVITEILSAIFMISALLLDVQGLGFVLAIIYGIVNVCGQPAMGAVTQDVVSPWFKGMSWGLAVFFMYVLGGGWAPIFVGSISDGLGGGAAGLKIALIIASLGGFLAAVCFYIGSKSYPADADRVKDIVLEAE